MSAHAGSARIFSASPALPVMMTSGFHEMTCSIENVACALAVVDSVLAFLPPATSIQSSMIVPVPSRLSV